MKTARDFIDYLLEEKEKRRLSYQDSADKLGMTKQGVWEFFKKDRKTLNMDSYQKLRAAIVGEPDHIDNIMQRKLRQGKNLYRFFERVEETIHNYKSLMEMSGMKETSRYKKCSALIKEIRKHRKGTMTKTNYDS